MKLAKTGGQDYLPFKVISCKKLGKLFFIRACIFLSVNELTHNWFLNNALLNYVKKTTF